ncbi:hypothetical protein Tco_1120740 [Tanacetum coccineum]
MRVVVKAALGGVEQQEVWGKRNAEEKWQDTYQNRRPTRRCGKLEKDGDKAMNEENERKAGDDKTFCSKPRAMKISRLVGDFFLQFQFSIVLTPP